MIPIPLKAVLSPLPFVYLNIFPFPDKFPAIRVGLCAKEIVGLKIDD